MLFVPCSDLSILLLKNDNDIVMIDDFDEVLEKRPSSIIYCVKNDVLYGIVSVGDIRRAKESERAWVNINTSFFA